MKKRLLFRALISLLFSAAVAQCQQITIQSENGKQAVLTRSDKEGRFFPWSLFLAEIGIDRL